MIKNTSQCFPKKHECCKIISLRACIRLRAYSEHNNNNNNMNIENCENYDKSYVSQHEFLLYYVGTRAEGLPVGWLFVVVQGTHPLRRILWPDHPRWASAGAARVQYCNNIHNCAFGVYAHKSFSVVATALATTTTT